MKQPLRLLAGAGARQVIAEQGLTPASVALIAGAAGGPKWLMLKALDDWLFGEWLVDPPGPIDLVGSSIGAWRFAVRVAERAECFFEGYVEQRYSERPSEAEVTGVARAMAEELFDDAARRAVVEHERLRLAILAARCRGPVASESRPMLAFGLATTAALNCIQPRLVGLPFARHAVTHRHFDGGWLQRPGWRATTSPLTGEALIPALMASGSIPLVLEGVRDLPGAPPGIYRDGGITDYHVPLPFRRTPAGKLVLFPHFSSTFKPGWFDKLLPWRSLPAVDRDRTLAVVPSDELIASLPGGRIPDRHDFMTMDDQTRIRAWRAAVASCERFADAFAEWVVAGAPVDRIEHW